MSAADNAGHSGNGHTHWWDQYTCYYVIAQELVHTERHYQSRYHTKFRTLAMIIPRVTVTFLSNYYVVKFTRYTDSNFFQFSWWNYIIFTLYNARNTFKTIQKKQPFSNTAVRHVDRQSTSCHSLQVTYTPFFVQYINTKHASTVCTVHSQYCTNPCLFDTKYTLIQ